MPTSNHPPSNDPPLDILRRVYGYSTFRGEQRAIIEHVCQGGDALVLMPTGSGKSLCYQIPSLLRPGVGIVVSPLIALMQNQVDAVKALGVRAAFLNSSLSYQEQSLVEQQLHDQQLDLLYVAPERLLQPRMLDVLDSCQLALLAIDEAHCVSQWGHDFREDYLSLHIPRERYVNVPCIALTATADQRTRTEIIQRLALKQAQSFVSGFDRPNIRYSITPKTQAKQQLFAFLQNHPQQAGIVYCLSRKKVETTAEWLVEQGYTALPYHAGLPTTLREHHQNRFLREDGIIIVATIAFGMGIDKPDVRFVAHLDLPKSIEAYYQETGRAGRDGEAAEAWMVYGLQDVIRLQQIQASSTSSEQFKRVERSKLDAMLGLCEITTCRRHALLAYFGDPSSEHCGYCDNCQTPPQTWEATEAAQKLLSYIYRTGQRFGLLHIIDVLRGKHTDKVSQFSHHKLSTFGIGSDISEAQWRSLARQLLVRGLLHVDVDGYGALHLTKQCRAVLRGEQSLQLRIDTTKKSSPRRDKDKKEKTPPVTIDSTNQDLWEALRACRKRLAEHYRVPPYIIFHDSTLRDMLQIRPTSPAALLAINGVGQNKLEKYGEAFIETIREYET